MLYSLLERHNDGSWWYHPGWTFDTPEKAEEHFKEVFQFDPTRPHKVFKHEEPMFQEYSTSTFDFEKFDFGGYVHWPKEFEGTFARRCR